MKLLIVDDEKLTREGIRDNLDLENLGISQVFLEDDGIHGLNAALDREADIVLTDVRMPRMNGVHMAEKLLEKRPGTVIIFMSAYSDKEYLKAAIKLKAVSYVEKPLDMAELASALREAVESCKARSVNQEAALAHEKEQRGHLALLLMEPERESPENLNALVKRLELPMGPSTCFVSLIIDCQTPVSALPGNAIDQLRDRLNSYLEKIDLAQIYIIRADRYINIFLYSSTRPKDEAIYGCAVFTGHIMEQFCRFFISVGSSVSGMDRAYISFREAEEHLKSSFFHEYGSILTHRESNEAFRPPADVMMDFSVALADRQEERALDIAEQLYTSVRPSEMLLPSQVKDIYYRYLSKLDEAGLGSYISLWQKEGLNTESIWEGVMNCTTLKELHDLLCAKLRLYFERLRQGAGENPVVFQIKEYIHKNYAVPSLSVPDVSQYVHLSSNYVCTIFKNETGQTLNQYLTDYRIKMSKQFLSDPRYKIADISSKVGYSDGNYYSKTFKKLVGLSPSEYREKMLV
ncbi:MAG: response regulator [Clostridium sp.]|nr:response regulator [Clostridium sp.]